MYSQRSVDKNERENCDPISEEITFCQYDHCERNKSIGQNQKIITSSFLVSQSKSNPKKGWNNQYIPYRTIDRLKKVLWYFD